MRRFPLAAGSLVILILAILLGLPSDVKGAVYQAGRDPTGSFDSVTRVPGGVQVTGWAIDPDTASPIDVHAHTIYPNEQVASIATASGTRPDVAQAYPGYGPNHGFDMFVPVTGFRTPLGVNIQTICIYGMNAGPGSNSKIGCKDFLFSLIPFGYFDSVTRVPGGVQVTGWAIDPDTADPIDVHAHTFYPDIQLASIETANRSRNDVAQAYPGYGPNHGFDMFVPITSYSSFLGITGQKVCIYGMNAGSGSNGEIGCKDFLINFIPFGYFENLARKPGGVQVTGWAIDPDTSDSIAVEVYDNGNLILNYLSIGSRDDIAQAYPGYGPNHGFDWNMAIIPAGEGGVADHTICVRATNAGAGPVPYLELGCKNIKMVIEPFGNVETIDQDYRCSNGSFGCLHVVGWGIDPESTLPININIYDNSTLLGSTAANLSRPDVAQAYPFYGSLHGYDIVLPNKLSTGDHNVCIYAINSSGRGSAQLGCKTWGPPRAPSISGTNVGQDFIETKWSAQSSVNHEAEYYYLDLAREGGAYQDYASYHYPGSTFTTRVTGLLPSTKYCLRMTASNTYGINARIDCYTTASPPTPTPTPPSSGRMSLSLNSTQYLLTYDGIYVPNSVLTAPWTGTAAPAGAKITHVSFTNSWPGVTLIQLYHVNPSTHTNIVNGTGTDYFNNLSPSGEWSAVLGGQLFNTPALIVIDIDWKK